MNGLEKLIFYLLHASKTFLDFSSIVSYGENLRNSAI